VANVPSDHGDHVLRDAALVATAIALVIATISTVVLAWGAIRQRHAREHKSYRR
jgi:hypothetical protein